MIRAALGFIISKGFAAGAGFLLAVLLPFVMPLKDVGQIYLVISLVGLLNILQKFGIDYHALNLALISDGSRRAIAQIYIDSIWGIIPSTLLVSAGVALVWAVAGQFGPGLALSPLMLACIIVWSLGISITNVLFQMYKALGDTALATLTRAFFHNCAFVLYLLVAFTLDWDLTAEKAVGVFAVLAICVSIANSCFFLLRARASPQVSESNSKPVEAAYGVRETTPYFLYSLSLFALGELDVWLLYFLSDAQSVGLYSTAKRFLMLLTLVVDFSNVAVPSRLAGLMREERWQDAQKLLQRVALLSSSVAIGLFVFALFASDTLFQLVFGGLVPDAHRIFVILVGAQAINLMIGSAELVLLGGKAKELRLQLATRALLAMGVQATMTIAIAQAWPHIAAPIGYAAGVISYRVSLALLVRQIFGISTYARW